VKPLPENTVQERVEQRKERQQGVSRIFKKKHNSGRRHGHGEGERVHLLFSILVTAPVFHLDKSWLNARAEPNTAREGATKKVPFQKHKNKITKRVRIVVR
jgi:hypothetical protein